jgi:NitT/TauT family transport system substrate-binding protein
MTRWHKIGALLAAAALGFVFVAGASAEVKEVRISRGFGILYLPLFIMEDQKLLEKQAAKAGLGDIKVGWQLVDGGNLINDAMMAGTLDFAGTGAPGFITLWSKAKGIANIEVIGISGLSATSLWLNTNNPDIKSLKDFTAKDRIALPGIKTSLSAVVLQMVAAKAFGRENFAKLDTLTVGLPHPEALTALLSGRTEITAHFTSPPFSYLELKDPKIHRVLNSVEALGNITLDVVFAPRKFVDANPRMTEAFLAAQDEANDFTARDKPAAAAIFARMSKVKVSEAEVLEMLKDPDTQFSTTPVSVMDFADFMHLAGTIKAKPARWTELFIPQLHGRKGS